jgi:translation initiation factor IF-3
MLRPRVNLHIQAPEIKVITEDGDDLGIFSLAAALELARSRKLDLVEVDPNDVPPVCKLIDYGIYQFESREDRERRKHE